MNMLYHYQNPRKREGDKGGGRKEEMIETKMKRKREIGIQLSKNNEKLRN